jgi:ADP-heptose:LPS heptosyltransferase
VTAFPSADRTSAATVYAPPRPLMRHDYLVRSNKALAFLWTADLLARLLTRGSGNRAVPDRPQRILLANWAHIGDVLTSLPTIGAVRELFPSARIDLLLSRVGRAAVAPSGPHDAIHTVDHFVLSRAAQSRAAKVQTYLEDRRRFLQAAAAARYDVAIDLYPHFPPAAPLFRRAGIPVRGGFTSGGFGPLLTHPVRWQYQDKPIGQYGRDLIVALWPALAPSLPSLPRYRPAPADADDAGAGRGDSGWPAAPYVVIHTGAGAPFKEWPEQHWNELIALWREEAPLLVFCGKGTAEAMRARRIAGHAAQGRAMLFLDRSWADFTRLVAGASGLVCLESSAAHLAAAFSLPTVAIYSGTNELRLWGPDNDRARILSAPTGCAPCHRGCPAMACVRGVTPAEVLDAIRAVMPVAAPAAG